MDSWKSLAEIFYSCSIKFMAPIIYLYHIINTNTHHLHHPNSPLYNNILSPSLIWINSYLFYPNTPPMRPASNRKSEAPPQPKLNK